MRELPFQTLQCQNKQTLRLAGTASDSIVAIAASRTRYIDGEYFREKMSEEVPNTDWKNYPVRVMVLSMHWAISDVKVGKDDKEDKDDKEEKEEPSLWESLFQQTPYRQGYGEAFLEAIAGSENLDLYTVPAIQILIEYLYSQYRGIVLRRELPPYLLQLVMYFAMIYVDEGQY